VLTPNFFLSGETTFFFSPLAIWFFPRLGRNKDASHKSALTD